MARRASLKTREFRDHSTHLTDQKAHKDSFRSTRSDSHRPRSSSQPLLVKSIPGMDALNAPGAPPAQYHFHPGTPLIPATHPWFWNSLSCPSTLDDDVWMSSQLDGYFPMNQPTTGEIWTSNVEQAFAPQIFDSTPRTVPSSTSNAFDSHKFDWIASEDLPESSVHSIDVSSSSSPRMYDSSFGILTTTLTNSHVPSHVGTRVRNNRWKCAYPACQSRKVFDRACDLRKHYKRHFKTYPCRYPDCHSSGPACFSTPKDRDRHEALHNPPSVPCIYAGCSRKFRRMDNMMDHVKRLHRNAKDQKDVVSSHHLGDQISAQRRHSDVK